MSAISADRVPDRTGSDFVSGAITGGSVILLLGSASAVVGTIITRIHTGAAPNDPWLLVALLLNVAIIVLAWRRTRPRHALPAAIVAEPAEPMPTRDALTGLLDRHSFNAVGDALIADAGRPVALLMVGLDHFKAVNNLHGHAAGDALLRQVATAAQQVMPGETVSARLGGDEFAFAFAFDEGMTDDVERLADALVVRLSQPFQVDGLPLRVSASIGIARLRPTPASIEALLRAADVAMGAAKRAGRNRFCWFEASMQHARHTRSALEDELRAAIPNEEIVPYFEQQIDLATGRLTGFEVLARWEHPTRGVVTPDLFIGLAEESGLIADLSLAVMRRAFIAARDWNPGLTLSVNISPWQLKDAWFAQKVIKLLTETGFPASRLEVEITEGALYDNLPLAQSIIGSLKNQGIRLALDDFGTGYSSLAHLRALPFDRIKIDRSFIASMLDDPESAAVVNAIARLGDSLNLPTTAEGIETTAIEERLRAIGCTRGQGYLYGRPLSAANARRLLSERRLLATQGAVADVVDGAIALASRRRAS